MYHRPTPCHRRPCLRHSTSNLTTLLDTSSNKSSFANFYALDLDKALDRCSQSCHICASLQKIPNCLIEQSTSDPPDAVGLSFAADVMKRNKQLILVVRETTTSFTTSCIIENECHDTLRANLIFLCLELRPISGPCAVIRVNPAPGFASLSNDEELRRHKITVEIGRIKNVNKNPVAEKCIAELGDELLRVSPEGGAVSPVTLAIATANLNTRICDRGLYAREMWYQRDQFTNSQLPISDLHLIREQHSHRIHNHPASEKSKTPSGQRRALPALQVGDLVYISSDGSKTRARDRYLVVSIDGSWCNVPKFAGSQLRSSPYRINLSECFLVTNNFTAPPPSPRLHQSHKYTPADEPKPPCPPRVPEKLSLPPYNDDCVLPSSHTTCFPGPDYKHSPSNSYKADELTTSLPSPCQSPSTSAASEDSPAPRPSSHQRHSPVHLQDFVT
ncbi:Hypothetical predicted protein [Paramuricea clavata]|uniref:Uncharacterized protein n=1 Tax=Paramuricea clavata TaxID=317549 RepID=A0A7D9H8E8_PARCT|nr:Hypothetical predicted protein [Paramuricea clavata]